MTEEDLVDPATVEYEAGNYSPQRIHASDLPPDTIVFDTADDVKRLEFARHQILVTGQLQVSFFHCPSPINVTHSYLLKDEDPPTYIPCNSPLTVEHILISCIDFDIIRQNFYTASNLKDLFHNIHPKHIISFIHAIGLINKL